MKGNKNQELSVLFVCMGNICRSPAGEGILKQMINQNPALHVHVESCGIGDWHIGQEPDRRMKETAQQRGVILTSRAKQLKQNDFDKFDYILAADKEVLEYLYRYAKTAEQKAKISLITAFSSMHTGEDVPDPYYGSHGAFEVVLDMLEDSCRGILEHIKLKKNQ